MNELNQIILIIMMMINEGRTLTKEQCIIIKNVLLGGDNAMMAQALNPVPNPGSGSEKMEFIYGLAGLASVCGASIPTVSRYRERFEPARVHFGGRRLVWDRAKVIEIAKECKW